MKSTNRGENWNIDYFIAGFNADIAHSINTSFFLNNNTGIIGAGKIFRTINSGISWDSVTNSSGGSFQSIFFINDNTGWASYNYGYGSSSNLLLKTTNSGLNWFNLNASISTIYSLYFVNSNTGWFTGFYHLGYPANISRFYIYKTTDGGLSYATQLYNSTWEDMYSIFFINENTGWAGGTKLWKTTDGGNSWNFQSISVRSVKFINELTGFLTNNTGIYKSSNGGLNWEFKSPFEGINISVLDSNNYFIAGNYGTMIKTSNQGDNWEYLSQNTTSNSNYGLYFTNEFTGFCISHYWSYPPYPSSVLKTTDKGYHWNFVLQNTPNDLNDVYFNSASTGWLLGDNGLLYKSTNIGISWNVQNLNTSKNLYKMFFLTSNTGWILSESCIFSTTDAGNNWMKIDNTLPMREDILFFNSFTGFIGGVGGIYKTTNSGYNWFNILGNSIQDIDKDSENNLYAISLNDFFKSTDMGASWLPLPSPQKSTVAMKMINTTTGYLTSLRGNVLKTTNGGVSWNVKKLYTNGQLRSIVAFDTNNIWVAGDNGLIISTVGGGVITGITSDNTNIFPQNYLLSQNYPNPFNPQTKIKFDVPANVKGQTSNVKLIIYDLLGREVTTLVNEELKPGTYEADWDGSNYSSGVYFYKIISEGFVETKKMVLMK